MRAARALLGATTFLTRLPVGRLVDLTAEDVARGAPVFPVVGALVGAVAAGVALLLEPPLDPFPAAAVAVCCTTLLTGAFHLDGLADTFDATGGFGRERSLEIMRDSRIGTYGAAAVALALLVRVGAVAQLLASGGALGALVAAGAVSRGAAVALSALLPYAREAPGRGGVLTGRGGLWGVPVAIAIALGAARLDGLAMVGSAAVVGLAAWFVFRRWLGGVTGDALGATSEIAELTAILVAAALA
jgi:adenosylcobinamide-GDP ribazoletransferase